MEDKMEGERREEIKGERRRENSRESVANDVCGLWVVNKLRSLSHRSQQHAHDCHFKSYANACNVHIWAFHMQHGECMRLEYVVNYDGLATTHSIIVYIVCHALRPEDSPAWCVHTPARCLATMVDVSAFQLRSSNMGQYTNLISTLHFV